MSEEYRTWHKKRALAAKECIEEFSDDIEERVYSWSYDEIERLTKENKEAVDQLRIMMNDERSAVKLVEQLKAERNLMIEDAHESFIRVEAERDEAVNQLKIMMGDERSAVKERDRLRGALERLASPEAFLLAKVATEEETARMKFAATSLLYPEGSKKGL